MPKVVVKFLFVRGPMHSDNEQFSFQIIQVPNALHLANNGLVWSSISVHYQILCLIFLFLNQNSEATMLVIFFVNETAKPVYR